MSNGQIVCDPSYRMIVQVCPGLASYYRSMIPKSRRAMKPRWPPHITVVRSEKETPVNKELWGTHHGELVEFRYEPKLRLDRTYYWLNVWSERLSEIRKELGLSPKSRWTRPPSGGFLECFHITIANTK